MGLNWEVWTWIRDMGTIRYGYGDSAKFGIIRYGHGENNK